MALTPEQTEKAKRICKRIAKGETVKSACGMEGVTERTIRRWNRDCPQCHALYKKAIARRKKWAKHRRTRIGLTYHERLMTGKVFEYRREKGLIRDAEGNYLLDKDGVPLLCVVKEIEIQKAPSNANVIFELKSTHPDYKETDGKFKVPPEAIAEFFNPAALFRLSHDKKEPDAPTEPTDPPLR